MIVNFKSEETKLIFEGFQSRHYPPDIQSVALRKLLMLDAAVPINDLCVPPGNRLKKLEGDREGSIASVLMINGEFASFGQMKAMPIMWK
ncbi:MAG: type II toxin-antitoxin system RelE/ParE family toxin [Leptolyngbya sp. IPPAS B-1204]